MDVVGVFVRNVLGLGDVGIRVSTDVRVRGALLDGPGIAG